MAYHIPQKSHRKRLAAVGFLSAVLLPSASWAQVTQQPTFVQIIVNSPADGPIQANAELTLREAIEITNGTLLITALSTAEQQLVSTSSDRSEIRFNLPVGQTTIELDSVLPAIAQPGLTLNGTTQPGYDASQSATAEIAVPIPVVTIRPADEVEIFRGLTLSADNITVRGLSLYGFNSPSDITNSTPPADIFISHQPAPLNRGEQLPATGDFFKTDTPPSGIVIEQNWLGIPTDESMPVKRSGFGVSVFDSAGTTIQQNRIEYHNGSGIITGRQADNLAVLQNIIVGNGLSGMPDAIRLAGRVSNGLISNNLICGNDGSGVFMFKPEGAVTVADNSIRYNGQRLRRAAVYVMGDHHRVLDNAISNQKGSGVVVTAFGQGPNTQSNKNIITGNRFDNIEGLSIDLNTRRDRTPQAFQQGDGPNPPRNSHNRRQDTGNSAVNAPIFASPEFFVIDNKVVVYGQADPNTEIQLYSSTGSTDEYGPLSMPLAIATADEKGDFEFVLDAIALDDINIKEGLSAIATDSRYGTSEPARNTRIQALAGAIAIPTNSPAAMPQCTTSPALSSPPALEPIPDEPIPEIIQLKVPRNIHFALDQDTISPESAAVLDKIVAALKQYPSIVVDLHGHTDTRASASYNQDLARRRAENARQYLLSKGIENERMTLRSLGETALLVEETNRTNLARNRRVEFIFRDVQGIEIIFINQENDLQIEP